MPTQDRLDGLTVDCGPWWFNLRPSNTEPLLRLNLEAPTATQCDQHVAECSLITGCLAVIDRPRSEHDPTPKEDTDGTRLPPARRTRLPEDKGPLYYLGDDGRRSTTRACSAATRCATAFR